MTLTRKLFLRALGLGLAGIMVRCGPPDGGPDPDPDPDDDPDNGDNEPSTSCGATGGAISGNHGHLLTVPDADVEAGVQKTYDIGGGAPHNHEVTLTADHFAELALGNPIVVTSTSSFAHDHTVTVSCP